MAEDPPTVLHIGVIDVKYRYDQEKLVKKGKPSKRRRGVSKSITTGAVAEILEAKYSLAEKFFEGNKSWITNEINKSLELGFEAVMTGAPLSHDPYGAATAKIEEAFKDAISLREFDNFIPGVPTKASLDGVNHRLAHPFSKSNPKPRPSFRDTGLYSANIKVWVK